MSTTQDIKIYQKLRVLQRLDANRCCFVCKSPGTQYVVPALGTFICTDCSGVHMACGFRVKSISMGRYTKEEIDNLEHVGNEGAEKKYLRHAEEGEETPRPLDRNPRAVERWIKEVLIDKKFYQDDLEELGRIFGQATVDARPQRKESDSKSHTAGVSKSKDISTRSVPLFQRYGVSAQPTGNGNPGPTFSRFSGPDSAFNAAARKPPAGNSVPMHPLVLQAKSCGLADKAYPPPALSPRESLSKDDVSGFDLLDAHLQHGGGAESQQKPVQASFSRSGVALPKGSSDDWSDFLDASSAPKHEERDPFMELIMSATGSCQASATQTGGGGNPEDMFSNRSLWY